MDLARMSLHSTQDAGWSTAAGSGGAVFADGTPPGGGDGDDAGVVTLDTLEGNGLAIGE